MFWNVAVWRILWKHGIADRYNAVSTVGCKRPGCGRSRENVPDFEVTGVGEIAGNTIDPANGFQTHRRLWRDTPVSSILVQYFTRVFFVRFGIPVRKIALIVQYW